MMRVKSLSAACLVIAIAVPCARAQDAAHPMGVLATGDASVTGGLEVGGGVAKLVTNASVTANDHPAPIALSRGGHVLVCSTSEFHLVRSGGNGALIFGLDRGALEIYSVSEAQDVVLTPDLKFAPVTPGQLDLRLRVTREGDTCVDNAGARAPVLNVTDPFSSDSYRVLPGQHLLFVRGDLHKVVDHEQSACGCPSGLPPILTGSTGKPASPAQAAAAAAHPFPQAESVGLAPNAAAANEAPAGTASSQVTTSFQYNDGQGTPPVHVLQLPTSPPVAPDTPKPGFFHAIGRVFHRIFHPD